MASLCLLLLAPFSAYAAVTAVQASPDLTLDLTDLVVEPWDVVRDHLGSGEVTLQGDLGDAALSAPVNGTHSDGATGRLLSFADTVYLPNDDITANPGDVVWWDNAGGIYSLMFVASDHGVPDGVGVDAVSRDPGDRIVLSFDTTVELAQGVADDEDLVLVDGAGELRLFLDMSNEGVDPALDLDGVHVRRKDGATTGVVVSFDGSGTVGGVEFDDEDALDLDFATGAWQMVFDGSERDPAWAAADLQTVQTERRGSGCGGASPGGEIGMAIPLVVGFWRRRASRRR